MNNEKQLETLFKALFELGVAQTRAIMHITSALNEIPNSSPALRKDINLAHAQVDLMIKALDSVTGRNITKGDGDE